VAMQESHETRGEVDVEVVDLFIDEEWSGEGLGRARVYSRQRRRLPGFLVLVRL
jgi:hypothetical protein